MKTYAVTLTGNTPLLMHHDNIEWADFMESWKCNPANKQTSKAGDDRTPAWRWLGCCYHDGSTLGIPQENIMRSIMEGGVMVPVPGGKMGKTFKAQTQSGMMSTNAFWPLQTAAGKTIDWQSLSAMKSVDGFSDNILAVRRMGFDLLVKRAKIGTSKHIRVRPVFAPGWSVRGSLSVWDEQITESSLASILEYAGQYKGLGDWRPGGKTPGPYGTFAATLERVGGGV